MIETDTNALISRAVSGDADAFQNLAQRYYMIVYKIAYKWCGQREDAEDIAQDVFIKLPEKLDGFRGEASFTTWLYRLTINAAKDYARKASRIAGRERPFTEGFDAASNEVQADEQLMARQAYADIYTLPEPIRDAVLLVYSEEMNHKQAAIILGCAETTISWRIFQARKLLKSLQSEPLAAKRAYAIP